MEKDNATEKGLRMVKICVKFKLCYRGTQLSTQLKSQLCQWCMSHN